MLHMPLKVVDTFRKNCARLLSQDNGNNSSTV